MKWTDRAIILSSRPHGEGAAIVELFAREHGRYLGLAHGRRKLNAVLQAGNLVRATWRARIENNLGIFSIEIEEAVAATNLDNRLGIAGIGAATALLARASAERDKHAAIFDGLTEVLAILKEPAIWPALYVRWEIGLLAEFGYALDLGSCAVTGKRDELAFVSPRSGRAVSRQIGEPYAERLLSLPAFLLEGQGVRLPSSDEILAGLRLTRHFLERRLLANLERPIPDARLRLEDEISALAMATGRG